MARAKKIDSFVGPEVVPEVVRPVVEDASEVVYPEVAANGKFQFVQFGDKYVVYNPSAQRVTGAVSLLEAQDIVRRQNIAAHIKG